VTIWYDFTTTVRNRGRSGIASTEWNIGQALLAVRPETRCFQLSGRRGLVELDPSTELAAAVYASSDAVAPIAVNAVPTWRDDVRRTLRARFGPRADPAIRMMSRLYQLPRAARDVRSWARRPTLPVRARDVRSRLVDHVQAGDVVVSMGADWDGVLAEHLHELKQRTGCAVVTMVYDLVPLTHTHLAFHNDPGLFDRYYRALVAVSDLITCISHQSRDDLVRFAAERKLPLPRAEVLLLGEAPPEPIEAPVERGDFFLCVGTIERRKNIELVYDALRILESQRRPLPTVVIAGAPGWGTGDVLHELRHASTAASRSMVLVGPVGDAALDRLYRSARALLFPSHFEGWGLPVREAAIRGCPVAAGDSPAVREAADGYPGATLLPPDDAAPWAEYMAGTQPAVAPAPIRPWSAVATDLVGLLPTRR
jgi:glycosyltransferase involved in cell wall biosynthesis